MKKLQKIPFTKEGFEELGKRYEKVLSTRKEAVQTLARAREMGDLSENGFYKSAKSRLLSIYSEIRRLETLIRFAIIVDKPSEGAIGIGSKITVSDGKNTRKLNIVGKFESDPSQNKISNESPIGRELIGKRIGDKIKVKTPKGEVIYTILKING